MPQLKWEIFSNINSTNQPINQRINQLTKQAINSHSINQSIERRIDAPRLSKKGPKFSPDFLLFVETFFSATDSAFFCPLRSFARSTIFKDDVVAETFVALLTAIFFLFTGLNSGFLSDSYPFANKRRTPIFLEASTSAFRRGFFGAGISGDWDGVADEGSSAFRLRPRRAVVAFFSLIVLAVFTGEFFLGYRDRTAWSAGTAMSAPAVLYNFVKSVNQPINQSNLCTFFGGISQPKNVNLSLRPFSSKGGHQ
jgi:hypothetical protein